VNKERELLNKAIEMIKIVPIMTSIGNVPPDFASELILEIQELLAQPETEPSDTEIITAYQMLVRRKLGLQEKNEVLQLEEPEFKVCENKIDGRCHLHNLQCQYPECEE